MNMTAIQPVVAAGPSGRLLDIDDARFHTDFARRPFRIAHDLVGRREFALPNLVELAQRLPAHRVEYNAGNVAINLNPQQTPHTGLSVAETIRRIEDCGSWLVLKNVELDPDYRELLDDCLAEIIQREHPCCRNVGLREAFIFISSAGAVTPYHMDPELNFLLQIHGAKEIRIFPGSDRTLLSEEELERFYSGAHRNLTYRDEYEAKADVFRLEPGEGIHVPVTDPHWVKVASESYSVSFSITFQTAATERRAALHTTNHWLRKHLGRPTPVGVSAWRDNLKHTVFRIARRLRRAFGR